MSGFSARIISKCLDTEIMSALAASSLKLIFRGEISRLTSALLFRHKIEIYLFFFKYVESFCLSSETCSTKLGNVEFVGQKTLISSFHPHYLAPK